MKNHRHLRYLDDTNRFQSPRNKLIRGQYEGKRHYELKKKLFDFLVLQDSSDVRCECIFKNGRGVADVIDFTHTSEPATVYEIKVTELKSSIDAKKKKFPYNMFKFKVIETEEDVFMKTGNGT